MQDPSRKVLQSPPLPRAPQESICAAAKGPQVTQQEPPASQKCPVTPVGSAASPRQLCSHTAQPWQDSQTPIPGAGLGHVPSFSEFAKELAHEAS